MTTTPRQSTESTGASPSSGVQVAAPEAGSEQARESMFLQELGDFLHQVRRGRFDVRLPRRAGAPGDLVDQVNDLVALLERRNRDFLIAVLAAPTAETARAAEAAAEGDLSQHMALEIEGRPLRGEFRRIGRTVNTMVDQLSSFADEVTRVAREVGTEGMLGGQADV